MCSVSETRHWLLSTCSHVNNTNMKEKRLTRMSLVANTCIQVVHCIRFRFCGEIFKHRILLVCCVTGKYCYMHSYQNNSQTSCNTYIELVSHVHFRLCGKLYKCRILLVWCGVWPKNIAKWNIYLNLQQFYA